MATNDLRNEGYDQEDKYYHDRDRELLEKLRAKQADQRKQQHAERGDKDFFLRCCKCGEKMKELTLDDVVIDQCPACGGIHLDAGELELLLKGSQPKGLLDRLSNLLG